MKDVEIDLFCEGGGRAVNDKGKIIIRNGSSADFGIYGEYGIVNPRGGIITKKALMSWKGEISADYLKGGEIYAKTEIRAKNGIEGNFITTDKITASYISCHTLRGVTKTQPELFLTSVSGHEKSCYVGRHIENLFFIPDYRNRD